MGGIMRGKWEGAHFLDGEILNGVGGGGEIDGAWGCLQKGGVFRCGLCRIWISTRW